MGFQGIGPHPVVLRSVSNSPLRNQGSVLMCVRDDGVQVGQRKADLCCPRRASPLSRTCLCKERDCWFPFLSEARGDLLPEPLPDPCESSVEATVPQGHIQDECDGPRARFPQFPFSAVWPSLSSCPWLVCSGLEGSGGQTLVRHTMALGHSRPPTWKAGRRDEDTRFKVSGQRSHFAFSSEVRPTCLVMGQPSHTPAPLAKGPLT